MWYVRPPQYILPGPVDYCVGPRRLTILAFLMGDYLREGLVNMGESRRWVLLLLTGYGCRRSPEGS